MHIFVIESYYFRSCKKNWSKNEWILSNIRAGRYRGKVLPWELMQGSFIYERPLRDSVHRSVNVYFITGSCFKEIGKKALSSEL